MAWHIVASADKVTWIPQIVSFGERYSGIAGDDVSKE